MYVPRPNVVSDADQIRAMVTAIGAAELVTVGKDGYPLCTRLPVVWDGDRLVFHIARANPHWRSVPSDGSVPALAVVTDAEAYVSPGWYAAKAEHGRVVPTWNYSAVQVAGRLRRIEDPEWLHAAVTLLTEQHEAQRPDPWAVTDAPAPFVAQQLKAIVGLELVLSALDGKWKVTQNRSAADRDGVARGLSEEVGSDEARALGRQVAAPGAPD